MAISRTVTLVLLPLIACAFNASAAECVVLLHGLARTSDSMRQLEQVLSEDGYVVVNMNYPSREKTVEVLAETVVHEGIEKCKRKTAVPINIVTHSLGGILVRQYLKERKVSELKRVVMLGPPNGGSEIVDKFRGVSIFRIVNGPAGTQLGTTPEDLPSKLGPADFELGVIAGTKSINPLLSMFLPNPDDGKVSVASAKIAGMCGFVTLPVTHTFMMRNSKVIRQVRHFLKNGAFDAKGAITQPCGRSPYGIREFRERAFGSRHLQKDHTSI